MTGHNPRRTVAITGISSYFGQVLLPLLECDPFIERVIGIDRRPLPGVKAASNQPGQFGSRQIKGFTPDGHKINTKLEYHCLDIRDPKLEDLIRGADILVHLAFILMRQPGDREIDDINIQGTRQVCTAAARQGIRKLVITSSVVAYGMHADNPIPLSESSPLRPNAGLYYSRAKASNERFLDDYARRYPEMIVTRLRPCTVVGPHAQRDQMKSLASGTAILVSGASPPIQLVHEADVASALMLAIQKDLPGVYNLTSDDPRTIQELVRNRGGKMISLPYPIVKSLMAFTWMLGLSVFAPEWADLSRYSLVASNDRLKAAGWQPEFTTEAALAELLTSYNAGRSQP